jgi:hypothetical protein
VPDHVVDTNVLLVASAAHPYAPSHETHVPVEERLQVLDWLMAFREDDGRRLVLDDTFAIYEEYRNKLNEQDVGLQVIHAKMQAHRTAAITWDADGAAIVPADLQVCDPSDRKFLAAALTDTNGISIVNATDSDWIEIEDALKAAGVVVDHVIEPWLRTWMARRER